MKIRNIVLSLFILPFFGTSALAYTGTSQTRVLTVQVAENDEITATLCKPDGTGCLSDKISLEILKVRFAEGKAKIQALLESPDRIEEIRADMKAQIEQGLSAVYMVEGLGNIYADQLHVVDNFIDRILPGMIKAVESTEANIASDYPQLAEAYRQANEMTQTFRSEKDFGEILDKLTKQLYLDLK